MASNRTLISSTNFYLKTKTKIQTKMKKFIYLLSIMALCFVGCQEKANSQVRLMGSHTTFDTVTNAGTTYLTTQANAINVGKAGKYRVSLKTTNISGTSTFKAILQGSLDGTNWVNYFGTAGTNGIQCDTLQVTAAAPAYFIWSLNPTPTVLSNWGRVLYLRVACVGTGTQSTRVEGLVITQE
jgi:hypothetical protein